MVSLLLPSQPSSTSDDDPSTPPKLEFVPNWKQFPTLSPSPISQRAACLLLILSTCPLPPAQEQMQPTLLLDNPLKGCLQTMTDSGLLGFSFPETMPLDQGGNTIDVDFSSLISLFFPGKGVDDSLGFPLHFETSLLLFYHLIQVFF